MQKIKNKNGGGGWDCIKLWSFRSSFWASASLASVTEIDHCPCWKYINGRTEPSGQPSPFTLQWCHLIFRQRKASLSPRSKQGNKIWRLFPSSVWQSHHLKSNFPLKQEREPFRQTHPSILRHTLMLSWLLASEIRLTWWQKDWGSNLSVEDRFDQVSPFNLWDQS